MIMPIGKNGCEISGSSARRYRIVTSAIHAE
jgi:hypothetical protein